MKKKPKLKTAGNPWKKEKEGRQPLWRGPREDGITFSMLNRFLECRERFRLKVVEGIRDEEGFQRSMEYGNMWHVCEEHITGAWRPALKAYSEKLYSRFPEDRPEITKWWNICYHQFEVYTDPKIRKKLGWDKQPIYVLNEVPFRVPYILPSGDTITMRGKFDGVFLRKHDLTLQENKTKGEIDEQGITQTIDQNMQTMFYLIALNSCLEHPSLPKSHVNYLGNDGMKSSQMTISEHAGVTGLLYNVVRRPLADRYAIRQKKSETTKQFYERVKADIAAKPEHFFHRWTAEITPKDLRQFQKECLDPILMQLVCWWESIKDHPFDPWTILIHGDGEERMIPNPHHWRTPFGLYNSLAGGFRGSYFNLLTTGSKADLEKVKTLYPELEGD